MGASLGSAASKDRQQEHGGEAPRPDPCKKTRLSSPLCTIHGSHGHPRLIPGLPDEVSLQILARMPRMGYLKAKMVSRSWKAAVTGAELYRLRKELGVAEEWLYILTKAAAGGQKLVWHALDPVSNQWQRLPLMPGIECRSGGVYGLGLRDLVSVGVGIFDVIRGWLGQKELSGGVPPFCGCAVGAAGGCLYVLGGFSGASASKRVWRYDPSANSWREVSPMRAGRAFCKASLLNDKLYVVGGVSKGENGLIAPLRSAEVFDPATGAWAELPDMLFSKSQAMPTAIADLLKPVAAGVTSYGGKLHVPQSFYSWPFAVDVGGEVFDPETNSWEQMPAGMGEGWPARQAGTRLSAVVEGDLYALEPATSSSGGCEIKMYDAQEDAWKVAVSQVRAGAFDESDSPCLLAAFLGKLHLVVKDMGSRISVMQMDSLMKPVDSPALSAATTCRTPDVSSEQTHVWKAIASKNIAAAELVSCQVLSI
jgi:hypothetical protein